MMECSNTTATILFLLGKEIDWPREVTRDADEQSDDTDYYKKTERFLGDESGAEDDIPQSVRIRRNKKKQKKKKVKKKPSLSGILWSGL